MIMNTTKMVSCFLQLLLQIKKNCVDTVVFCVAGDTLTQKVTIYFTHSTPYEAFLTALGIAQDAVPLRADNYYQQTQRQWRTSTLSPFAANLAVVLYR